MLILWSISNDLEIWLANHISIFINTESIVFKNKKFVSEISNNLPNNLLGPNVYKTLEICW